MSDQMLTNANDNSSSTQMAGDPSAQPSDQWMATLAHELRNPLNAIVMALDMLRPICADEPSAREARDVAQHGSLHMARIIDDVLDLCRGTRGKLCLNLERVDLAQVVARAIETSRPLLAAGNHRLTVSLPPEPATLEADASRLQQILTNLLTNAAKYTNPGGQISLIVHSVAGALMFRIRDNGIGIAPDVLPSIFDLYRQGAGAQSPQQGGLGIGLALVKSLVELHGGSVAAYSDGVNAGSEFVVRLPVAQSVQLPRLSLTSNKENIS
jgi:signal transduction histidine kinase